MKRKGWRIDLRRLCGAQFPKILGIRQCFLECGEFLGRQHDELALAVLAQKPGMKSDHGLNRVTFRHSHHALPAAVVALAVEVDQDVAGFGTLAGADHAAVFQFIHQS